MIVGLDELKKGIAKKQMQDFAINIVKYQKFKTSVAIKNINYNASDTTKANYFDCGVKYIKDKTKIKSIPYDLYYYIDEALARHITPLTPSIKDERRVYKRDYTKKDAILPVAQLEIVKNKVAEHCNYAVMITDTEMRMCKNQDFALGFLEGLKYCGRNEAKVKTVILGDVNERMLSENSTNI